jgi:hypothetical protein
MFYGYSTEAASLVSSAARYYGRDISEIHPVPKENHQSLKYPEKFPQNYKKLMRGEGFRTPSSKIPDVITASCRSL